MILFLEVIKPINNGLWSTGCLLDLVIVPALPYKVLDWMTPFAPILLQIRMKVSSLKRKNPLFTSPDGMKKKVRLEPALAAGRAGGPGTVF